MGEGYVPEDVKRRLYDAAVDAASRAAHRKWPRVAKLLAWFRSDSESEKRFGEALDRACETFLYTQEQRNASLASELRRNSDIWKSDQLYNALRAILTSPGTTRFAEWDTLRQLFADRIPQLAQDAALLDGLLQRLISCMAAEVSLLSEFRDLYRFEFERRAAQSTMQLAEHLAGVSDFLRTGGAVPPVTSLPAFAPTRALPEHGEGVRPVEAFREPSDAPRGAWSLADGPHPPSSIVVVGPDTRRIALLPTDATPDYSYLEFFGDKDTILEASVFLARKYPNATIARYPASWIPSTLRSMPLVVVGGPNDDEGVGGNRVARQVMDYHNLPINYHEDCEGLDYAGTQYRTTFGPDGRITLDWGLVVRVRNPWNANARVLLIQGVHTHGVLGAFRAITDPSVAKAGQAAIEKVAGDDPLFAALIRVDLIDGVATSARLDQSLIRAYPA